MAKYYTKSPEICILAANYFAGFQTMDSDLRKLYWREYYSGRKIDPTLALKYAHYFLDHWDVDILSLYEHSGSFDAFRVVMDYEIGGLLSGKYGFKKDPAKAISIYRKWVGKESISGRNAMGFGFKCSQTWYNGWTICLFRQISFYSVDTEDFINKCNLLIRNGMQDDLKKEVNLNSYSNNYPANAPYDWKGRDNVHDFAYYISGCKSVEQLEQLEGIFKDFGLLDDTAQYNPYVTMTDAINQQKQSLGRIEDAKNQETANTWYNLHKNDKCEVIKTEYDKQDAKVRRIISSLFDDDVVDYIHESHSEEELLALKNHPLASDRAVKLIDSAVEAIRNDKWSKEQYESLLESKSIPGLKEFMGDSRITTQYKVKSEELLAKIMTEQKEVRDQEVNKLVADFEAYIPTADVKEEDLALGSLRYNSSRDCFMRLRESFNSLEAEVDAINNEYPDLNPNNPVSSLEMKYRDQLLFADLIIMEDEGKVLPINYEYMMVNRPNLYPSYIQDNYAISRAKMLTKQSDKKEIKEVKQLPMSEVARKQVAELTKKSYLSKK